jgi:hypothetical protein
MLLIAFMRLALALSSSKPNGDESSIIILILLLIKRGVCFAIFDQSLSGNLPVLSLEISTRD